MKTAYINGFILDGTADMQPRRETVIVENGKITDLIPAGALLPADCPQRRKSRRTMCALLSLPPPIL